MNMEQAYNDQMNVTRQIVEELKLVNVNIQTLIQAVSNNGNNTPSFEDFLGEVLGGFGINAADLLGEIDDEPDDYDYEDDYEDSWGELEPENLVEELEFTAEDYIHDLLSVGQLPYNFFGNTRYAFDPSDPDQRIDFHVNENTGVTIAYFYDCGSFVKKAQAKCDPNDIFIPIVGHAIALHRLFDLEVPEDLLQK